MFIRFHGASVKEDPDGSTIYTERGPIDINSRQITGYYEHTILTTTNQIRVMETYEQIREKLEGCSHG